MELNNYDKLQILTAKTGDLHVRMSEKIREKGFSLCNNCSNHGRNCVVSDTSMEERKKMIAIRDSLQQLHNILLYLQRVRSSQEIQRDEALARLKESREILIERVNQFPEKKGKVDVIDQVIEFIGDGKSDEFPWCFNWKIDDEKSEHNNKNESNGIFNFVVGVARFGLEFGVIFTSIYASVKLCRSRQQNHGLQKDARILGKSGSEIQLDVLCGRG